MKNEFKEELWTPVIQEHPKPSVGLRKHKPHIFSEWQPPSERYRVHKALTEEEKSMPRCKAFESY